MQDQKPGFWQRTKEWFLYGESLPAQPALETYTATYTDETGTPSIIPPPRATASVIDPRRALQINAVYSAVSLLATSVSQLPLQVMRGGTEIPAPLLITRPDPSQTLTEFLALSVNSMALWGNCYWRLHRVVETPGEPVVSIEVLNPEMVYMTLFNGKKVFEYRSEVLAEWQVAHLKLSPIHDPATRLVHGVGPIQANRAELQAAMDLNDYIRNFFLNNGIPNGILTTNFDLADGEGDAIRKRWYEVDQSAGLQVLSNGLTYQQISMNPADLQFHAMSTKVAVDVARIFGIPDRYLLAAVEHTSMTYTNAQDVDKQFVTYTLMKYIKAIEDALSDLLPRGQVAVLNVDGLLRGSTSARYAAYSQADWMTVNEKRALEGLPPIKGGNTLSKPAPQPAPQNPTEGAPPTN